MLRPSLPPRALCATPPAFPPKQIHADVAHKHIAMLYGAFQEEGRLVLVQEYAARGDLYGIYRALRRRMTEEQVTVSSCARWPVTRAAVPVCVARHVVPCFWRLAPHTPGSRTPVHTQHLGR